MQVATLLALAALVVAEPEYGNLISDPFTNLVGDKTAASIDFRDRQTDCSGNTGSDHPWPTIRNNKRKVHFRSQTMYRVTNYRVLHD